MGAKVKRRNVSFLRHAFFIRKEFLLSSLSSYQPQGPSSVMYYYPHFCGFAWNVSDGCAKENWHTSWIYIFEYINFEVSAKVWLYTIVMATFWEPLWISWIDWHSELILKNRKALDWITIHIVIWNLAFWRIMCGKWMRLWRLFNFLLSSFFEIMKKVAV